MYPSRSSLNTFARYPGGWANEACPRTGKKLARVAVGFIVGLALSEAMLLPCDSNAAEPPRQAVRVSTWLDLKACAATPDVVKLSPDLALGLLAFNSPYLFGGRALRSQLTCGACHAKDGPSGAAVRLRMRAAVPELRSAADKVDVAAFVDHAVVAEFDGPPLPRRTARALSALARVLAPFSSDPATMCRVNATSLVAIGLQLAIVRVGAADAGADELDFLLESLRFILGEMARDTRPEVSVSLLGETNRALHDALRAIEDSNGSAALASLQRIAAEWESTNNRPHFMLMSNAVSAHE
jgi:hypothetical protein